MIEKPKTFLSQFIEKYKTKQKKKELDNSLKLKDYSQMLFKKKKKKEKQGLDRPYIRSARLS